MIAGLISGIIGGILIGSISYSHVSVSGPAASLSAVVLVALEKLGSFEVFLLALVIGGLIQLVLGFVRAGVIADYMPTSIIKGLLAAIGLILIFSQIPYALGMDKDSPLLDLSLSILSDPPEMSDYLRALTPGAVVLTAISLAILIFWDKTILRRIKQLPPFLVVVIIGVILNMLFKFLIPSLYLEGPHLVNIPSVAGFNSVLTLPKFSAIGNPQVWVYGFTIAFIASIASLMAIEAADNLDPHKRRSPPNRELIAQGIGNTVAGLIGGIPITSVIVRSSVNIEAGAETKLSAILHGVLLLASVLVLSSIINLIPLASLAAILLVVGYKLASLDTIKKMYGKGLEQFIPFVVTTIGILLTDVLIGVLIGSAASLFFLLRGNFFNPFYVERTRSKKRHEIRLELSNEVSFLNKPAIKKILWDLPRKSKIIIDATFTTFIDQDVIEILNDFQNTFAIENNIEVVVIGLKESYSPNSQIHVVKDIEKLRKDLHSPQKILDYLHDGNQRYVDGNLISRRLRNKELMDFIKESPLAVVINCNDMREPLNILLNTGIGDLIPLRATGNLVSDHIIFSTEVACRKQGAKLILLMGHSKNSFIRQALDDHLSGRDAYLYPLLEPALNSGEFPQKKLKTEEINRLTDQISSWNLEESKKRILEKNPHLKEQISEGKIGLCSAFFDRKTGKISFSELYKLQINS